MSKRKFSKSKLPVICGADEDPEWLAGSGASTQKGKDLIPPDGNTGKFALVTREDVLAKPTNTPHSSKAPGSPHPSCTLNEVHEFDDWCSDKPSDSSSSSTSSSNSNSSPNSSSSTDSSKSSRRTGSFPGRSGKSPSHREEKGSAKGGGVDIGGHSKPGEGNGDNQDTDEVFLFKEDNQDGKSSGHTGESPGCSSESSGHRDEKGSDEGGDIDIGGDSEPEEGDGDNQDNDGDDWSDQDDQEGAGKTLTLPPQGPKKRDTDTELDKSRADWFTNEMNVILDRRLGPNHIPSEWFQSEMDEIIIRHKQYSAGIMHKCEKCENLPHDQKPCSSYKMFFRADGTKRNEDESKEAFVQDLHTVLKYYLEDEKFRDWGERDQAISHDPSTPPSTPSDPPSTSSPPPAPSLAKPVGRPVLSEHLEKYFRERHEERVKKRSRFSNKLCLVQSKQTGLTMEQVRAINDQFEAERKQRKPMVKYNNKDWKIGTAIMQKWQKDNPRPPTDKDYEWLTAQTGRSRHQIATSLKQYRRKVLKLNLNVEGREDPKSHPKTKGDDKPQRHFPRQDVAAPRRPKPQGGKSEAYKALRKEMLEEERKNDHQKAVALTSKVVKNKRQASTRRLSDEGAPKVARTAENENIVPEALDDATVRSRAGEEASTSKHKNKRQASLRKLSEEGPGKVAKSAVPTSGNIGPQNPVKTRLATKPPTSVAQGSEVPPHDVGMFNLDHVPIHYDYSPDMMTSTRLPPTTDPLDGLDEELAEDQSAAEPNATDFDYIHGLSYDDILDQDIDAPIDADLDPFLDQDADLTGGEVDMYADDIENEMYMHEALTVIEADLEGVLEPNEEEAEASVQRRESSAPYQKKRTNRINEDYSKPSPAPNVQTSDYDHDYDWFAKEIWEQMGGRNGPEIYPTVEDKMGSIIRKYKNWSRGNLRHLEQGCDNSSDVNLCCYKGFDSSKDGSQVLLDFKIEIIKTINTIIQNTPGERLHKFPQHATNVLWELSKHVDGEYRLTGKDRITLIEKTGLEDPQIQKWWYHFHIKKQRKLGTDANLNLMTSQDPPPPRPGSNPLNVTPKTTFAQRREKYFSAAILPKKGGGSSNIRGGEPAQEETDFDNIEPDPSHDSSNGESSFKPFCVGVYENAFREIWADMGGTKGAEKYPRVDVAVQPIIDLYKLWVQGKARHLNKSCDPSSDPLSCCWTRKFGPPKKPKQVFLEFQVEVTQTINKIIKERKIERPDLKIHRFPKFSRENLQTYSKSFNNALHDLDHNELDHLKSRTGLEAEQIRKWWEQYHNRPIKQGKKGPHNTTNEGDAITKDGSEMAKKQGRDAKNRTQRGYEIDMATLANIFEEIVNMMINLNWASVFAKPVSKEEAPDYLNFVTKPMDLDTIRKKAHQKLYKHQDQFREDVWQIVLNAHKYYDNEASLHHDMPIAALADKLISKVDRELEKQKGKLEGCIDRYGVKKSNKNAEAQIKTREEVGVDLAALANIFGAIVDKLYNFNVEPFSQDLFVKPVPITEAPDYSEFVKKPMDLGVIHKKVRQMEYKSQDEFRMDVKQIVLNAHQYNDKKFKSKYGDIKIPPRAEALFELCNRELKMQKAEIEACMTRS